MANQGPDIDREKFAQRLRTLRKKRQLTQEELARLLRLKRGTIAAWEAKHTIPSLTNIYKLASFFGVSTDYLRIIAERSIELEYDDLQSVGTGLLGLYVLDPLIGHLIILDKQLLKQPRLHRCVLAEEIGHSFYPPRTGTIRFHRRRYKYGNEAVIVAQDEAKALRWATDFLIPDAELWRAMTMGYTAVYELADYFNVEEWFVRLKFVFLEKRGLNFRDVFKAKEKATFGKRSG